VTGDRIVDHVDELGTDLERLATLVGDARAALSPLSRGSTASQVTQAATVARMALERAASGLLSASGKLGRLEVVANEEHPSP
jgi:hypothetical protein